MTDLIAALDKLLAPCPNCSNPTIALCDHDTPVCQTNCCRNTHGTHCRTCNGYGSLPKQDNRLGTLSYSWTRPTCPDCDGTGKRTP